MSVPTTAGFDPSFELMPHQQVKFQPVAITTTGYMYVWVSNESEDTKVWFDDLAITQSQDIVTQATDYGVWGEVLREQKTNVLDEYRYAYQGQFAEKDDEMGWSSFELRMFDPIIARWLIPDPNKQYWSPYMAMGNNPINLIDPDGGMDGDPNPFGKGDNYVPDQGGGRSYYATILDEVVIRPSFTDFVQDLFDAFDGKLGFFITGGGSENFGQSSSTGKDIVTLDWKKYNELLGLNKEFKKLGISKHNPNSRTFENPTSGDRVGEISETISKFYEVLEIHGSRHKNPNLFIRQVEYEPGKYATDTIFLGDGDKKRNFTDTLIWYDGRLRESGYKQWHEFWRNKAKGSN